MTLDDDTESIGGGCQNLDKVYSEASQWVRLCNQIIWQMSVVFVPTSVGAVGLALAHPSYKIFFAVASIFLFAVWVTMSFLYRGTSSDARNALMNIEANWGVPESMSVYRMQGQVGKRPVNLYRLQLISLAALTTFWILFFLWK
jgi:HJR/Mrr/RecB family endonuclease